MQALVLAQAREIKALKKQAPVAAATHGSGHGCVHAKCACAGGNSTTACPRRTKDALRQCVPWGVPRPVSCFASPAAAGKAQRVPVSMAPMACCYATSRSHAHLSIVTAGGKRVLSAQQVPPPRSLLPAVPGGAAC